MNAEILNVLEQPIFDSAIVNFEKRTHDPYSSKNLNNNDEIHISIQQQDTYTAPYFSVLYIRGRLCRAADGMPSQTATLDRMGVLLLFSEIRYVMNAETVDKSRNPGLTALMKGYASFNQNECVSLENAGWSPDPHFFDSNGNFDVCIPLKMCLGFAEDFRKIILNTQQDLILIRASTDTNAIINTAADEPMKVELERVSWRVPHVSVAELQRLQLLKCVNSNIELAIPFRSWELHELPLLPETQTHMWNIKTSTQLERPRYIIFGFQVARKNNISKSMSQFDHCNLNNFKVFLNSESYPYDNLNIDFSKNFYATLYDMYAQFQSSYYQKENEPYLTTYTFKHLAPLVVVDCSCQKEVLKNGAVDIRLEFNTKQNIPKDTAAYCLIIHDKIIRYTPLTSLVRTY
ncbi:hypothetical protein NQ318_015288 [Aromia moschata]|uniref:Double jelly roll-like domain-containing protein n=1 Tax=Aromia moschata TaxID=1265417 RepID=A0AAV8X4Q9_9CUCU|nr:hypothetical protein NQ318_007241 [Aromia moschata]KAJ8936821.1 hypothetical protein NQ318_015288 [Aromia moschata]